MAPLDTSETAAGVCPKPNQAFILQYEFIKLHVDLDKKTPGAMNELSIMFFCFFFVAPFGAGGAPGAFGMGHGVWFARIRATDACSRAIEFTPLTEAVRVGGELELGVAWGGI